MCEVRARTSETRIKPINRAAHPEAIESEPCFAGAVRVLTKHKHVLRLSRGQRIGTLDRIITARCILDSLLLLATNGTVYLSMTYACREDALHLVLPSAY